MDDIGDRHSEDMSSGGLISAAMLRYFAGGIALAFALIVGCLAWFGAALLDQDLRTKRSARQMAESARALALENHELRSEVAKVRQDLEKRRYTGAVGECGDAVLAAATPADAPGRQARSALAGKSMITRAGM